MPLGLTSTIEGEPLSPDNLSRDWCRGRTAKQLPPVPFHALRHTHASMLLGAGVDVLTVSRRLGHGKASVTLDTHWHLIEGADAAAEMSKRMELRRKKKAKTVRRVAAEAFRPHQFQVAKEARIREARNWRLALALTGQDLTIH